MPSYEEEAFSRARQMNSRTAYSQTQQKKSVPPTQEKQSKPEPAPEVPKAEPEPIKEAPLQSTDSQGSNLLDSLFKNKEQSIILILIMLLMEDNAEPTLLLALVYLLM